MKLAPFALVAVVGLMALQPFAQGKEKVGTTISMDLDPPARWEDLHDVDDAQFAITTENHKVVLLLTRRVVAMQLSDRVLRKINRKVKDAKEDKEDTALGQAIKTAVLAGVKSLLNHSAEIDIRDIAKADYRNGELILVGHNGKRIFSNVEVDNEDVMQDFSDTDARAFVRQLRQRMGRGA